MAERKRVRRNTLERRCLGKAFKRLFVKSPKGVFKMLEKIKRATIIFIAPLSSCCIILWCGVFESRSDRVGAELRRARAKEPL